MLFLTISELILNTTVEKGTSIRIDGGVDMSDRDKRVKMFQDNDRIRIAFLSIRAAGEAITLTASSTVWFAELSWTPAQHFQAEARCHRIGQRSSVECRYFIAKKTLDGPLWKLIKEKLDSIGQVSSDS